MNIISSVRPAILVVEDNVDNSELLCELLEYEGFNASAAFTGQDAIQQYSEQSWMAIVIDFNLPDMTGVELAEYFRRTLIAPPLLVAATGLSSTDERLGQQGKPFDVVLCKPLSIEHLLLLLRSQLQRQVN